MNKELLNFAQIQLGTYNTIFEYYESQLNKITPDINNGKYIKLLNKLSELDTKKEKTEQIIKQMKKRRRIDKRLMVALNNRVKLVAVDIEITLWVDAKNVSAVLGKRIGEIVDLYNAQFRIAAIY